MLKIPEHYTRIPAIEQREDLKWYVVHVGVPKNIPSVEAAVSEVAGSCLWVPVYKEYKKLRSHLILVDYLVYPGYIFVGVPASDDIKRVCDFLDYTTKGYVVCPEVCLSREEMDGVYHCAVSCGDSLGVSSTIEVGSTVMITAGPFAGLAGEVIKVRQNGVVELQVFFLNRDMRVQTTVLDIRKEG